MKKFEMDYGPFIYIIIIYLKLCIKFLEKSFLCYVYVKNLLTFAPDFFSYCSL